MKTIDTTATVGPDGVLTTRVPLDIPPGDHRVVLVIDEGPAEASPTPVELSSPVDFPVHNLGPWPEGLSLRREDLYDDWGR